MAEEQRSNKKKKKKNLFEREVEILKKSKSAIDTEGQDADFFKSKLSEVCNHYEELLDQSKLITKVSDRLQRKINKANEALENKNLELQETLDALTQAKVGRRAATITLLLFVGLFLIAEGLLEPEIEAYLLSHKDWFTQDEAFYVGLGIKGLLALLLRPAEKIVEKILLRDAEKRAMQKRSAANAAVAANE